MASLFKIIPPTILNNRVTEKVTTNSGPKEIGENNKSCWYYDDQLDNRLTSISLHANTVYNGKSWVEASTYGKVDAGNYLLEPLCRSVLTEDFNVSIANTWSDMGGDPISGLVNDLMHSAAPYANAINTAIQEIGRKADEWGAANPAEVDENGEKKFSIAHQIKGFADWVTDKRDKYGDDLIDFMNSNLIVQGTRFRYYSGTGISFGNLGMKFTIFPKWNGPNEFITVNQQLEKLFPYAIGKYESLHFTTKDDEGNVSEHVSDILGWQRPPAGYRADYRDIDNKALKGTLKLRIGAFYVLESLVCEGLSFSLSRQMVKKPLEASYLHVNSGEDRLTPLSTDTVAFSPLYADVTLVLQPATKYSDIVMKDFIYGLNMSTLQKDWVNEGAQELDKKVKNNLSRIKSKNETRYV